MNFFEGDRVKFTHNADLDPKLPGDNNAVDAVYAASDGTEGVIISVEVFSTLGKNGEEILLPYPYKTFMDNGYVLLATAAELELVNG